MRPKEHCFGAYLKEMMGRGGLLQQAGTKVTLLFLQGKGLSPVPVCRGAGRKGTEGPSWPVGGVMTQGMAAMVMAGIGLLLVTHEAPPGAPRNAQRTTCQKAGMRPIREGNMKNTTLCTRIFLLNTLL